MSLSSVGLGGHYQQVSLQNKHWPEGLLSLEFSLGFSPFFLASREELLN